MEKLMLGNEAIARGAYESGVTVVTSYPGTPSTEIAESVSDYDEINVEWSVNEKVALEIGIGSSIAGARTLVSMKHVGLNVAADPFMSFSYLGVNGGLVIVVSDDPGQKSSQNEQDTRHYARFAKIPILEPSDSQECKDFIKKAFSISEDFDTPVIVRINTRISHSRSIVKLDKRIDYKLKDFDKNPTKYVVAPAYSKLRRKVVEKRLNKLKKFSDSTKINEIEYNDKKIGVITSSTSYLYCKDVFKNASFLKIGFSYPLPKNKIKDFCNNCDIIYVVEELDPIIENQIKSYGIEVYGKDIFPNIGEFTPKIIKKSILKSEKSNSNFKISNFINNQNKGNKNNNNDDSDNNFKIDKKLPKRPPVLCSGCPHRGVFYVLNELDLIVSGDIGCYTLGAFPPLNSMHTSICMGASIGMAQGFEKARGKDFSKKSVAVIGDSTFWHSGLSSLTNLVYNDSFSTVIVLDNSSTAMTGHQDNPSTGYDINKDETNKINFESVAKSIGVKNVSSVSAFNLDKIKSLISDYINRDSSSLIVIKGDCVLHHSNNIQKKYSFVDEELCVGCKKCMDIGCPAISFNKKAIIDKSLCLGCNVCNSVCKFNAIQEDKR